MSRFSAAGVPSGEIDSPYSFSTKIGVSNASIEFELSDIDSENIYIVCENLPEFISYNQEDSLMLNLFKPF